MACAVRAPLADAPGTSLAEGLLDQCRASGDLWGLGLAMLARGALLVRAGSGAAPDALSEAAAVFDHLHAPVLAAWAHVLTAAALEAAGQPAAGAAGRAAAAARTVGLVPPSPAGWLSPPGPRALIPGAGTGGRAAPGAETVDLGLLGGFRLRVAGRPTVWSGVRPRALALLRRLALAAGADVHRECLVEALWPGVDLATGVHRLQVAVSGLRTALDRAPPAGTVRIVRCGEAYRLDLPPTARIDVRDVDTALTAAAAARGHGNLGAATAAGHRVLQLYRGDLLPEDGPADWVVPERDRLRRAVARAAGELAADHLHLGQVPDGLVAARRSLALDPYQDSVWTLLVALHEQAGDRTAARRAQREHAAVAAELGVPQPPPPRPVPAASAVR
ncbi:AfsR/SARP family transcriptional regulator [Geodermatophilus marinus]|uniref:AfsR/SARP family transcriptional regulator n=1 Tax=Geodermatophilus sp. LHW52908 TaxID=2303986 RepID=UPI000E3B7C6B|nr:bacterial transcriptional activator domain-containing protein [Geodermatophilus sp. LHW52908]RFU18907.1 hypothetical protein D0Z06_24195 [Geodermatophilus sp. LHW52908]